MTLQEAISYAKAAKQNDICSTSGRALAVLVEVLDIQIKVLEKIKDAHKYNYAAMEPRHVYAIALGAMAGLADALESQPQEAQAVVPTDDQIIETLEIACEAQDIEAVRMIRELFAAAPQAPAPIQSEVVRRACDLLEGLEGMQLPSALPVRVEKLRKATEVALQTHSFLTALHNGEEWAQEESAKVIETQAPAQADPAAIRNAALEEGRSIGLAEALEACRKGGLDFSVALISALKSEVKEQAAQNVTAKSATVSISVEQLWMLTQIFDPYETDPDEVDTKVVIGEIDGHSGHGLYAWDSEYPDECVFALFDVDAPQPQQVNK